jgi:hypothetical protein
LLPAIALLMAEPALTGETFTVAGHADTDAVIDTGARDDSAEDLETRVDPVFDAANQT